MILSIIDRKFGLLRTVIVVSAVPVMGVGPSHVTVTVRMTETSVFVQFARGR
jgi:hypothetical protein